MKLFVQSASSPLTLLLAAAGFLLLALALLCLLQRGGWRPPAQFASFAFLACNRRNRAVEHQLAVADLDDPVGHREMSNGRGRDQQGRPSTHGRASSSILFWQDVEVRWWLIEHQQDCREREASGPGEAVAFSPPAEFP